MALADVIVIGLGAMGASAALELAARGLRVIGIDRYSPPHDRGSSHGRTRIIREAYFEHPAYVPLVQRAYERWADLEKASGASLLAITGGLMIGPPAGSVAGGAESSAKANHLQYERLSASETSRRYPAFHLPDSMHAIFEPRAGVLMVEAAITTLHALARRHGAVLRLKEPVVSWSSSKDGVEVRTARNTYSAAHAVLAAGPWASSLIPELRKTLQTERTRMYWFRERSDPASFEPERLPIFILEHAADCAMYGFPDLGDGIKVAIHHGGDLVDPDDPAPREAPADRLDEMRHLLARYLPSANGELLDYATCLYTNTPDYHFILDTHPGHQNVVIASPCSGHGFKFAPVVGEIVADLVMHRHSPFDLTRFSLRRRSTTKSWR